MKYISDFFGNLIVLEALIATLALSATGPQISVLGPLISFGIFVGAPLLAAIIAIED
jgi:hypothetical protein